MNETKNVEALITYNDEKASWKPRKRAITGRTYGEVDIADIYIASPGPKLSTGLYAVESKSHMASGAAYASSASATNSITSTEDEKESSAERAKG